LYQQANGGQWNTLGTYNFNGAARVVVIAEGNCTTCADAVRFVPITQRPEVIMDTGVPGTSFTKKWCISMGEDSYNNSYNKRSLQCKKPDATYSFEAGITGYHEVYAWWTCRDSRCSNVPVEIYDGDTRLDIVYLYQQANGGQWNMLDTYDFNGTARVVIISEGDCTTCADAVRFVPVEW